MRAVNRPDKVPGPLAWSRDTDAARTRRLKLRIVGRHRRRRDDEVCTLNVGRVVPVCDLDPLHGEDDDIVIISEQDMLGDKLARPRKRKSSAAVIAEAAALSTGDLIVHVEHGVGRLQ